MMAEYTLYRECTRCGGDGLFPNETMTFEGEVLPPAHPVACTRCNGTGKVAIGIITTDALDDILDKCNDILDKCNDIFEQLTE